jgi:threonine/homoserine/homoserine lactone efflux protein
LNPHPYLFWVTVGAPLILKAGEDSLLSPLMFVSCFYLLLVGSKMFLALIVGKSSTFLTSRGYIYVMRILGGMLAVFALFLFKDALIFLGVLGS